MYNARMNTKIRTVLSDIARKEMGIDTLETQRSDRLDFHDVAVWTVLNALEAAYLQGLKDAKDLTLKCV
jgi:hypothetical protein